MAKDGHCLAFDEHVLSSLGYPREYFCPVKGVVELKNLLESSEGWRCFERL
jgi:hypothetical protein